MGKVGTVHPVATGKAPSATGPFSQGVTAANLVFCSGRTALDPQTGGFVAGGIKEHTHQVLKNIQAVLEAAGSGMAHIVKTTVFLTNMSDFQAMNSVYGKYFKEFLPARSTVQVAALPKGAPVEIEAIALIP